MILKNKKIIFLSCFFAFIIVLVLFFLFFLVPKKDLFVQTFENIPYVKENHWKISKKENAYFISHDNHSISIYEQDDMFFGTIHFFDAEEKMAFVLFCEAIYKTDHEDSQFENYQNDTYFMYSYIDPNFQFQIEEDGNMVFYLKKSFPDIRKEDYWLDDVIFQNALFMEDEFVFVNSYFGLKIAKEEGHKVIYWGERRGFTDSSYLLVQKMIQFLFGKAVLDDVQKKYPFLDDMDESKFSLTLLKRSFSLDDFEDLEQNIYKEDFQYLKIVLKD